LVAVTSSNLNVALIDSAIRQMAQRTPPGGGQGFRHQGGPGRTRRPQGGSPHDGLARSVHVLYAQESCAQVRERNGLGDYGACLKREGVPDLLGDGA
jgi:hypothetical protein